MRVANSTAVALCDATGGDKCWQRKIHRYSHTFCTDKPVKIIYLQPMRLDGVSLYDDQQVRCAVTPLRERRDRCRRHGAAAGGAANPDACRPRDRTLLPRQSITTGDAVLVAARGGR